jgi:hypothetical protein
MMSMTEIGGGEDAVGLVSAEDSGPCPSPALDEDYPPRDCLSCSDEMFPPLRTRAMVFPRY